MDIVFKWSQRINFFLLVAVQEKREKEKEKRKEKEKEKEVVKE